MQPADRYRALIAECKLTGDPAQEKVAAALDALAAKLSSYQPGKKSFLGFGKQPEAMRGIYIYGPVGRGKSMLMDMFYASIDFERRRRIHFHDFMAEVHANVKRLRDLHPGDPLPKVAAAWAARATLLCLDEFQVSDIADAMILARLFSELFDRGVVIVATSNRIPSALYENGINRQLFLPAIRMIEARMDVVKLDGPIDYRLARLERSHVYFHPLSKQADADLENVWMDLTGVHQGSPATIEVLGRELQIPEQARGVARFSFEQLCVDNLGPQDFLAIADNFHAIVLKGIPQLTPDARNEAKRFVTLIDALYERCAKFICTAAVAPHEIYKAGDGSVEFERTSSRLIEMQTPAYLARLHQPKK